MNFPCQLFLACFATFTIAIDARILEPNGHFDGKNPDYLGYDIQGVDRCLQNCITDLGTKNGGHAPFKHVTTAEHNDVGNGQIVKACRSANETMACANACEEGGTPKNRIKNFVNSISAICSGRNVAMEEQTRRKRGVCNMMCSCGWGSCEDAPGYNDSWCCGGDYAWYCCT